MDTGNDAMDGLEVSFYGSLRSLAGGRTRWIPVPGTSGRAPTAGELRAAVARELPQLAPHLDTVAVAAGIRLVPEDAPLDAGEEIALLPPVSGG